MLGAFGRGGAGAGAGADGQGVVLIPWAAFATAREARTKSKTNFIFTKIYASPVYTVSKLVGIVDLNKKFVSQTCLCIARWIVSVSPRCSSPPPLCACSSGNDYFLDMI